MDAQKFVGMTVEAATVLANEAGLKVALNAEAPALLTASMQMNRITFHTKDGLVTAAKIG